MAIRRNAASNKGYENYFAENDGETCSDTTNTDSKKRNAPPNTQQRNHYTLAADAGPLPAECPLTMDQIHKVLAARRHFQRTRNYAEADRLLRGLQSVGIYCHDARREFRADGINSFGAAPRVVYVQRGWTPSVAGVVSEVTTLVAERCRAKQQRRFPDADALKERLINDYRVHIDDKRQEWSFDWPDTTTTTTTNTSYYVPSRLGHTRHGHAEDYDESTHTYIQQQLHDRFVARRAKDYARADAIRDVLLEQYRVVIDDRTREYQIMTNTSRDDDDDEDAFEAQARASQRSAFARTQRKQTDEKDDEDSGSAP